MIKFSFQNSSTSYNYGGHEELLKTIFLGERAVLEAKYQKLYEPLYTKVCTISADNYFLPYIYYSII